jgi:hypothetical protein
MLGQAERSRPTSPRPWRWHRTTRSSGSHWARPTFSLVDSPRLRPTSQGRGDGAERPAGLYRWRLVGRRTVPGGPQGDLPLRRTLIPPDPGPRSVSRPEESGLNSAGGSPPPEPLDGSISVKHSPRFREVTWVSHDLRSGRSPQVAGEKAKRGPWTLTGARTGAKNAASGMSEGREDQARRGAIAELGGSAKGSAA